MKGTGTPHLNQEFLKNFQIFIPSLPTQEKIVQKIEELFSELDKGVEELTTAKAKLKVYRQAVLKEAFEGKLTKEVCGYNESSVDEDFNSTVIYDVAFKDLSGDLNALKLEIPKHWKLCRIGEMFSVEVGATPSRKNDSYWNGDICWASSGEVKFSKITKTKETITEEGVTNSSTKVQPKGTVLLAMIGEGKTRGQAAVLDIEAAHNQNTAAVLVSKTSCCPLYIYYFFQLNYEYIRSVGSGNNQKALNKERVKAILFPFCSFVEQNQIVAEIESRLSICDQIEATIEESLKKSESLRQSILKEAFEGRLV